MGLELCSTSLMSFSGFRCVECAENHPEGSLDVGGHSIYA